MDERRISTTRSSASEVARANFTTLRKGGYDPDEVRTHLESVAREMGLLETRVRELQEQLAAANRRAVPAPKVVEETKLASALGAQSAAILRASHEEAARVTAEAQERSAQLIADSQERSAQHIIEAQERAEVIVTEAEKGAADIDLDARLAAERLIESAKKNGEALVEQAREQGHAIVEQANAARRTILNDLAVKRKALHLQIEQLRAARDTMASSVGAVSGQIEQVLIGLNTSDELARHAALEALRNRPATPEPTEAELLAGTPLRAIAPAAVEVVDEHTPATRPRARRLDAPATERTSATTAVPAAPSSAPKPTATEDDGSGTDVVNEIFARLRKATLDERGVSAPARRGSTPKESGPDGALFLRRDRELDEALTTLTRRVKRALQDDQNTMLDALRGVDGIITTELEDEKVQRARYAEAAFDGLVEAAAAGARFAANEAGLPMATAPRAAIVECSADLAVTITLALRKRILADTVGDGQQRANAAYKEWRGGRVERLCTDAARRAFAIGVLAATAGRHVRFVVAPTEAPCDACALDAAAGVRVAGEKFPSGSAHPPLHAGCACSIVPA